MASSTGSIAVEAGQTLDDHTHWLCFRGMHHATREPLTNNSAIYGSCVATAFDQLEVRGLPTHDSPGYVGLNMELVILKKVRVSALVYAHVSVSQGLNVVWRVGHERDIESPTPFIHESTRPE